MSSDHSAKHEILLASNFIHPLQDEQLPLSINQLLINGDPKLAKILEKRESECGIQNLR